MAESISDRSPPPQSPENVQTDGSPRVHEETHGRRDDIDENTSLDEVRAPNVFERVKEEIEALVQTIHSKDGTVATESKEEKTESQSDSAVIAAKVFERAKDEIEKMLHIQKSKETHGQRDDIGEDTPLSEVKAPNLLKRAVEEYEAFMQTIHSKKESQTHDKRDETANSSSTQQEAMTLSDVISNEKKETDSPANEGFFSKLGKWLEIICSPSKKKDD